jgi:hypothetical protein
MAGSKCGRGITPIGVQGDAVPPLRLITQSPGMIATSKANLSVVTEPGVPDTTAAPLALAWRTVAVLGRVLGGILTLPMGEKTWVPGESTPLADRILLMCLRGCIDDLAPHPPGGWV